MTPLIPGTILYNDEGGFTLWIGTEKREAYFNDYGNWALDTSFVDDLDKWVAFGWKVLE